MPSLPIKLQDGFSPLVSVGDTISLKQPLASKKSTGGIAVINVPHELSLPIAKAAKTIKKNPGDSVEPGDVIAARSGFLGMGDQRVVSSVRGMVASYERRTGDLTLQIEGVEEGENEVITAPVEGKVISCDNEQIVIETDDDSPPPEIGTGGSVQGEIYVIEHTSDTPVPLHLLTTDIIGKIVVASEFDREGLLKIVGMDVLGVVVLKIAERDLEYLTEKKMVIPLVQVSADEFKKISKKHGKQLVLDGEKKNVVLLHG